MILGGIDCGAELKEHGILEGRRIMSAVLRRVFSFQMVLGSILIVWVTGLAAYSVWDPDLWFHLRNVEYLLAHGRTPQVDVYSYTTSNHPLVNHQWLAEIPFFYAWRAGGLLGVFILFVSLLLLIHFGIRYLAYRRSRNLKSSYLVACLSGFLTVVSFGPRTLLFGYVCLVILLVILERYRSVGSAPLWGLPALFCLWINFHGTWLLGIVIMGTYIASGMVEGSWERIEAVRWTPAQLRKLLTAFGASLAALFVNPFSYKLVIYPFEMALKQKLNVANTDEWASVDFNTPRGMVAMIMLGTVLFGILLSTHKWRLEEVVLGGLGIYSGLTHIRFLFLAAILLAPLVATMLDMCPPYRPEIDKPLLNGVVMAFLVVGVVHFIPSNASLNARLAKRYPVQAAAFMQTHGLTSNIFNFYAWGGYLVGCCPEIKTFIDSRADIFEYSGVMKDYLDAENIERPLEVLEKYKVNFVLLPPNEPLTYLLKHSEGWKLVYADDVAAVLQRE